MNVVLMHDWLVGMRGGERVLAAMAELYPKAPIYTLIHTPGSTCKEIEEHIIKTSWLNKIKGIEKSYRKFLPLFPLAVDAMKITEEADIILSSSHCVIKGIKKNPKSMHISYIHSPMRYMYDLFDDYFGANAPFYQRVGAKIFRPYLTSWDILSNQNVDVMVANSQFVAQRIKRYYQRQVDVIHPFVELDDFKYLQKQNVKKDDYYFVLSAFAPNKRVDLAIKACNRLNKRLLIVGEGQEKKSLEKMAGPTVEFLGNVGRAQVIELLSKAKALLFPGVEDFGITPLEALACQTPVIAYKAAGVLETLNPSISYFFEDQSVEGLVKAISDYENLGGDSAFDKNLMQKRAQDFSKEVFQTRIKNLVEKVHHDRN